MKPGASARVGFGLLEVIVATAAFATIGYVLLFAVKASTDSQAAISARADDHRVLRSASRSLVDELALAGDDTITVTTAGGAGAFPELSFLQRIENGATAGFGVMHLGVPHADWSRVYAVEEPATDGDERRLVCRIVDDEGVTQRSTVVARGLRPADVEPPGFRVVQAGDLWEITLATEGQGNQDGIEEVFHVRARN
jgi:hypothetical protein